MIADAIQQERENLRLDISSQINNASSQVDSSVRNYMSGHMLHVHPTQVTPTSAQEQEYQLYLTMRDNPQLPSANSLRDQEYPHDDAHLEGENNSYATDDEELPTKKVSQELMEEMKEILVPPFQQKPTLVVQSCQRDPKAPALSLVNQDLLYLKKCNSGPEKIVFIEKYEMLSIVSEPVYGIIYKNNKKEKRVMRHQEIHKFCDATLKRVLEGLKSYNNDVKYGYVTLSLSKEDVEYLQLFEEEIEERLKHRYQMRR
ncbi:hypothetical protein Tco_0469282 [Tanacetum coccineum]